MILWALEKRAFVVRRVARESESLLFFFQKELLLSLFAVASGCQRFVRATAHAIEIDEGG